jgi:hypothetical protein
MGVLYRLYFPKRVFSSKPDTLFSDFLGKFLLSSTSASPVSSCPFPVRFPFVFPALPRYVEKTIMFVRLAKFPRLGR